MKCWLCGKSGAERRFQRNGKRLLEPFCDQCAADMIETGWDIKMKPICRGVKVKLLGEDGNAFHILGSVQAAMKKANVPEATMSEFYEEVISGDYHHLIEICRKYIEIC